MQKPPSAFSEVTNLVYGYFEGLHQGDTRKLSEVFDPTAGLQTDGLRLRLDQWLERVAQRASPADLGHAFKYELLDIEVTGNMAMAKVSVPLLGKHYIDLLSCFRESERWRIVNKLYTEAKS